jgi:hypothetical protein
MSLVLLAEWLHALREQPGLSVHAIDPQRLFCVDPPEGPLLAIEWESSAHTLHLYGHPGQVAAARVGRRRDLAGQARVLKLSAGAEEQRHLHVHGDTGLMTLSVRRSLASLDRAAFVALVDDVLADMALWAMVCADAPAQDPHAAQAGTVPPPWGVAFA